MLRFVRHKREGLVPPSKSYHSGMGNISVSGLKRVETRSSDRVCSVHNHVGKLEPRERAREGAYADVALGGPRKRIFDIVIAGIVLVVLAPMLLVTVGLIRVLIGKSAIVVKQWIGFGGRVFDAYHFRTTVESREDASAALLWRNDHNYHYPASLGEALQASGLDKLPLLLNVLRGDMSLIGPRPIAPRELSRYISQMPEYFTARPGLT